MIEILFREKIFESNNGLYRIYLNNGKLEFFRDDTLMWQDHMETVHQCFISDSGNVFIISGTYTVTLKTLKDTKTFHIIDDKILSAEDANRNGISMHPIWLRNAYLQFSDENPNHFIIWLWYGKIIVFGYPELRPLALTKALQNIALRQTSWFANTIIRRAAKSPEIIDEENGLGDLFLAIVISGQRRLSELSAELLSLESHPRNHLISQYLQRFTRLSGIDFNNPFCYDLRRLIQLSLRRMGISPQGFPCYRLYGYYLYVRYVIKVHSPPISDSTLSSISPGISVFSLLRKLGMPTLITDASNDLDFRQPRLEFDIMRPKNQTLLVDLKGRRVSAVVSCPPKWIKEDVRDIEFS